VNEAIPTSNTSLKKTKKEGMGRILKVTQIISK
jgi:hypothetical protein